MQTIRDLLSRDLRKPIEEVIKVDQQDEGTVHDEIREYVATDRIKRQYIDVLKPIADAPGEPTEGVGVWVSGFFGSGKSHFAKILSYLLENRRVGDRTAVDLFRLRILDSPDILQAEAGPAPEALLDLQGVPVRTNDTDRHAIPPHRGCWRGMSLSVVRLVRRPNPPHPGKEGPPALRSS